MKKFNLMIIFSILSTLTFGLDSRYAHSIDRQALSRYPLLGNVGGLRKYTRINQNTFQTSSCIIRFHESSYLF